MPRLAALLFLAGLAVTALPRCWPASSAAATRSASRPSATLPGLDAVVADHLARLLCDCPACMPSIEVH